MTGIEKEVVADWRIADVLKDVHDQRGHLGEKSDTDYVRFMYIYINNN